MAQARVGQLQDEVDHLNQEVRRLTDQLEGAETAVNLGRTTLAAVSASSVQGSKALDDPFYGIRNAFDAGNNWVNDVNYTDWRSCGENDPWVQLTFHTHVSLTTVSAQGDPADWVEVTRIKSGAKRWPADAAGRVTFDAPIHGVTAVRVHFKGGSTVSVTELLVMGYVRPSVPLSQAVPRIDWDAASARVAAHQAYREWGHGPAKAAYDRVSETDEAWTVTVCYGETDMCRVRFDKTTGEKVFSPLAIMKPVATVVVPEE